MASMDRRDKAFRKALDGNLASENRTKTALAKKIGVSRPAINSWRDRPGVMTLAHFRVLVREVPMSDAEILSIIKG